MAGYSATVMDHFHNPRNAGELTDADAVGTAGQAGAGPVVQIAVKIREGVIAGIAFKTYGCGASIAASSLLTEMAKGMTPAEALRLTSEKLLEKLGGLPLGKRHCPELAVAALHSALKKIGGEISP